MYIYIYIYIHIWCSLSVDALISTSCLVNQDLSSGVLWPVRWLSRDGPGRTAYICYFGVPCEITLTTPRSVLSDVVP